MDARVFSSQNMALAALRVSLGMLLVWWGLAKIFKPGTGVSVQKKFYFELFPGETLQFTFGFIEAGIGLLVVLGLWRKYAVIAQLLVTGFSALTIWSALLDPFGLWLPVEKIAGIQHLFYPTVIALCAAFVMIAFRREDRFCLDNYLSRASEPSLESSIPAE